MSSRPVVLLGEFTGRRTARLQELGWGRMWLAVGRHVRTYPGEPWGFDNAAFRLWRRGQPFEALPYQRRLWNLTGYAIEHGAPYLAVVPDIVAAGERSLRFSRLWVSACRGEPGDGAPRTSWPWFLAVQDGMELDAVAADLHLYDGLFLGGTAAFKWRTAAAWSALAHGAGKRFHYARAGTLAKLAHAVEVGADSVDSAFPMWTAERWARFERAWLDGPAARAPDLFAA